MHQRERTKEQIAAEKRAAIRQAMRDRGDRWVIRMTYTDKEGNSTRRVISPYRWKSGAVFYALCLGREDIREFYITQCSDVELVHAHKVAMPEPIKKVKR